MSEVKLQEFSPTGTRLIGGFALACLVISLAACGNKEKASSGQSLARVDGQEITQLQLNNELAQAKITADQKDAASKKLLDILIDRQLVVAQATRDKVDRDPVVVAAIERAKSQIIAQAFIQRRLATVAHPTKEELDKYYIDHPDFFAERKVYDFDQVIIGTKDFGPELKADMTSNKTLDDMVGWIKAHHINYLQNTATSNTVDLPTALVKRLKEMRKGQVFALQQNDNTVIAVVHDVKDAPIKQDVAEPQISAFLLKQRNKEAADSELSSLRAAAKIEYLNKKLADASTPAAPGSNSANGAGTASGSSSDTSAPKKDNPDDHVKRGVADL